MKVIFCSSEVVPFAKTGGLADVAGALPGVLKEQGAQVAVVMPRYKQIDPVKFKLKPLIPSVSIGLLEKDIPVYFIESSKYFDRDKLYGDQTGDYSDNLLRFSYFCQEALRLMREIRLRADIIHCNDWQTALIPVYLKTRLKSDEFYRSMRTVFTIHNLGYQGLFPGAAFPSLGLDSEVFGMNGLEFYGKINLLKGGINYADCITTVSPTYALQIQTKEQGFGLEGVLGQKKERLFGIINGLDYSIWNPGKDHYIPKAYSTKDLAGKMACKLSLQKECGLAMAKDIPLFGVVSRLAAQKGFDIIAEAIQRICQLKMQLVILGTGDLPFHKLLTEITQRHPKQVSVHLKFDDPLAHRIYAGSDIFLMPSHYEPCGLGQMISFKYGTLPLVHKTGGLADTVQDFEPDTGEGNGFVFDAYTKEGLLEAMMRALLTYQEKALWKKLVTKVMRQNFSWTSSAKEYLKLYKKLLDSEM